MGYLIAYLAGVGTVVAVLILTVLSVVNDPEPVNNEEEDDIYD